MTANTADPDPAAGPAVGPAHRGPTALAWLLEQARDSISSGNYQAAFARLDEAIAIDRRNPDVYRLKASCALALAQPERALKLLAVAERNATDPVTRGRIDDARIRCLEVIANGQLERARESLRRDDPAQALAALRLCEQTLGDDRQLRDIRAYARLRLRRGEPDRAGPEPGSAREPGPAPGIEADELERVLRWLAREELTAAKQALDGGQLDTALEACDEARRIDPDGAYAALLHAIVVTRRLAASATGQPPALESIQAQLADAARSVRTAQRDPSLRADVETLSTHIDEQLATVGQLLADRRSYEAVDLLCERFDRLVSRYTRRAITLVEVAELRSSLAPIEVEIDLMRERHEAGSPAGRRLTQLAGDIAQVVAQLP